MATAIGSICRIDPLFCDVGLAEVVLLSVGRAHDLMHE